VPGPTGVDRRDLKVLGRRRGWEEVVALEDEAERVPPQGGAPVGVERADLPAGHPVASGGRPVEAADDVHERRLARARLPHDRDELAVVDLE
jgi:hypothetical protein